MGILMLGTFFLSHERDELIIANLDALTAGEGIPVNTCYMENVFGGGSYEWTLACDKNTSTNMIYDCPTTKTYIRKTSASMCHATR